MANSKGKELALVLLLGLEAVARLVVLELGAAAVVLALPEDRFKVFFLLVVVLVLLAGSTTSDSDVVDLEAAAVTVVVRGRRRLVPVMDFLFLLLLVELFGVDEEELADVALGGLPRFFRSGLSRLLSKLSVGA
jgi:hypothetical protein